MTFLIIYSIIISLLLAWMIYSKWFMGNGYTRSDIDKLQAENEVLKIQHGTDIKKLAEVFGDQVPDNIDDIISSSQG